MKPLVGLSLMHEQEFLQAALPLFVNNEVEVVEWSFDTILNENFKPIWLHEILKEYSANNRLIGHGVRYSLFDAKWTKRQDAWLKKLAKEIKRYSYNHITEHFGFMSSNDFHKGAPLPVSLNKATLRVGHDRIKRLQQTAENLPLGIENLAFAFSIADVKRHGEFLHELIKPINGFLILDLHNIYCQAENFKTDFMDLVRSYPLEKVREIHISGGSWQNSIYSKAIKKVRRDTHDDKVPAKILEVLPEVLKLCPNLQYIIFERLGTSLMDEKDKVQFRKDFLKIRSIVDNSEAQFTSLKQKVNKKFSISTTPLNDAELYKEQRLISKTLAKSDTPESAFDTLKKKNLHYWNISEWNPSMLETALYIAKKWEGK